MTLYQWLNSPRPVWVHLLAAAVLIAAGVAIGRSTA